MKVKFICLALSLSSFVLSISAQTPMRFDFGASRAAPEHTLVRPSDVYSRDKGFGFESGASVVCSATGGKTAAGFCSSDKPFYFSVAVPEGNYKVTITFGDKNDVSV